MTADEASRVVSEAKSPRARPESGLLGRRRECEALDRLLEGVRDQQSRVLALRGEAGVGKTALLEYLVQNASGCRIGRAAGIESEMELPFSGLHQLCGPMLDRLGHLPMPQRDALGTAFGLSTHAPADPFLVGLAVLSLLAEVADRLTSCSAGRESEQPAGRMVEPTKSRRRVGAMGTGVALLPIRGSASTGRRRVA